MIWYHIEEYVPTTFFQLRFWSKLDFWNAYNLVRIRHEWKTAFNSLWGQSCWTPSKYSGHFFLVASGSPSCIAQVITPQSKMLCAVSCLLIFPSQNSVAFYLLPAPGELFTGKGKRGSWWCNKKDQIVVSALQSSFCSWFCPIKCPAVGAFL